MPEIQDIGESADKVASGVHKLLTISAAVFMEVENSRLAVRPAGIQLLDKISAELAADYHALQQGVADLRDKARDLAVRQTREATDGEKSDQS